MSVAEYLAGFISIIIGLALADIAVSLQRLLRAGRRVTWDLLTPASVVLVTAFIINVWWASFGALNAMTSISVASFVPDLISLLLLFSLASSALPDEIGSEQVVLADYYRDNSRWFWGLFALYTLWVTVVAGTRAVLADATAGQFAATVVPNIVVTALMVTLIVVRRKWVHVLGIASLLTISALAWLPQELGRAS